jgi:hypothetical protein
MLPNSETTKLPFLKFTAAIRGTFYGGSLPFADH